MPTEQLEHLADLLETVLDEAEENKKPTVSDGGMNASRQFNNAKINNEIINLVNRVKEHNLGLMR